MAKSELTEQQLKDEPYSLEWLEAEWSAVSDIQDRVGLRLPDHSPPVQSSAQKLVMYTKQMESLELDITSKVDKLEKQVSLSTSISSPTIYTNMIVDKRTIYKGL